MHGNKGALEDVTSPTLHSKDGLTEDHHHLSPKHTQRPSRNPSGMHRHRRDNKVPSASKAERYAGLKIQRDKSREQHCEEKLMELFLLNCPDLSPCSYLIKEGNK